MFRILRNTFLLSCFFGAIGCHSPSTPVPTIKKGDYTAIISYLQSHIPSEMGHYNVQGLSIALINGQELIWAEGFGYANKDQGVLVSPNTAFRAGGISKLITATAALQLVEQRRLTLDAPIQNTLKEFHVRSRFHADLVHADRSITLRRLLSHQSGLPSEHLRGLHSQFPLSQIPERISGTWLVEPPGTRIIYSNLGYALVGAAIERSAGLEFEYQLQRSLLKPLKMEQSSFVGSNTDIGFRSQLYRDGAVITDTPVRDLTASGLWSNPKNLSHYVQMLFARGSYKGARILTGGSIDEMLTQQNVDNLLDFDCQVGLGWHIASCGQEPITPGIRIYQQGGTDGDFPAQLTMLPDQQLAVIIMANDSSAQEMISTLSTDTLRMMLRAQSGKIARTDYNQNPIGSQNNLRPPDALDRKRLAGVYATPKGVFRIKDENNQLCGELAGSSFELLRDDHGWLRAQKKLLGFRLKDLGDLGRVQLDVVTVQGRQILITKSHGQRQAMGEWVGAIPLNRVWTDTVGTYQLLNTDEPDSAPSRINVRLEDGFLVMRGKLYDEVQTDYILLPVDNAHAVIAGSGYRQGDTVSRQVNGLGVSGYHFKRIP